jgi:DNA-binding response OmpR family regulator
VPSILLVEDNPADATLVREALEHHNVSCEVVLVTNGETAIEFLKEIEEQNLPCPDLVILDLNLPRRSGADVLKRMRASVKCGRMTVAVLTSSDSQRDKDETASLGASRYIRKPSRLAEFIKLGGVFREMLHERAN